MIANTEMVLHGINYDLQKICFNSASTTFTVFIAEDVLLKGLSHESLAMVFDLAGFLGFVSKEIFA